MRVSACILLALLCGGPFGTGKAAEAVPNAAAVNIARFRNGDSLRGLITGIDRQQVVSLTSPLIKEAAQFSTEDLSRIIIEPHGEVRPLGSPRYLVRLVNGDALYAGNIRLSADNLVMETWYAGELTVPRAKVRTIRVEQDDQLLYSGPDGLDGWTVSSSNEEDEDRSWAYQGGVFYSKAAGGIARDLKLPGMMALDMDVAWRSFLQLTITIYTDSLRVYRLNRVVAGLGIVGAQPVEPGDPPGGQKGAGFYAIQINRNTVYLLTVRPDGRTLNSSLELVPGLERVNRASLGVRVNKEQKTISLLIDGNLVKTWNEPEEFAGQGSAVRIVQQGAAPVNISNIKLSNWDGTFASASAAPANLTEDFVQLRNADTLSGKLEAIGNGELSFTSAFGNLKIPTTRVAEIDLPTTAQGDAALEPGMVRAHFATQGYITVKLDEWKDGKLTLDSPTFGKATFDPAAFSLIVFSGQP